jgi:hypothetical protein
MTQRKEVYGTQAGAHEAVDGLRNPHGEPAEPSSVEIAQEAKAEKRTAARKAGTEAKQFDYMHAMVGSGNRVEIYGERRDGEIFRLNAFLSHNVMSRDLLLKKALADAYRWQQLYRDCLVWVVQSRNNENPVEMIRRGRARLDNVESPPMVPVLAPEPREVTP